MRPISTPELATALGVDRWVLDQAISRGIIKAPALPAPGAARAWGFEEAMRVAAMLRVSAWVPLFGGRARKPAELRDGKLKPAADYYAMADGRQKDDRTPAERIADALAETRLHGFNDDAAFLIVRAIDSNIRTFEARVVRASALVKAVQRPLGAAAKRAGATVAASLLVDLGAIELELLEAWPAE